MMELLGREVVNDTIDTAKDYVEKLEELIRSLGEAEIQVNRSATETEQEIDESFNKITIQVTEALEKRRKCLKAEVLRIKCEGLTPLKACRKLVCEKLEESEDYIKEGIRLLESLAKQQDEENPTRFCEKASFLGSLPAVPKLEEVPKISFELPLEEVVAEITNTLSSAGRVSRMGPVQLSQVEEKPGALLVRWEEVDLERAVDVISFRLQCAHGDLYENGSLLAVNKFGSRAQGGSWEATPTYSARFLEANFHDIYEGSETELLVRDLKPGEPYTFRVCCCLEGDTEWSAWSLPRVAATYIEPFSWDPDNINYLVTNECKIAAKITNEPSILFSRSAQFGSGHSIEFTILEAGVGCSEDGLALLNSKIDGGSLLHEGSLFLNAQGCVFVDGAEKTTHLPPLVKGSLVAFSCVRIQEDRIRVNIDSNNKTVTYDWRVEGAKSSDRNKFSLYFALCFGKSSWKVLVE